MSLGAYGLIGSLVLPTAAAWAGIHPRLREHWLERVGWRLPTVEPGALWLHAASLGEGQAAAAVAAELGVRRPELPLLRTATSETGREQVLPVDELRCLPLDAPWLQRRFIRRVRPRALVLVEGELWPGLLSACAGRIPVAVLGLRAGEGTRRLARRFPGLWRAVLGAVGSWSARDDDSAAWLSLELGHEVPVIGELKLEAPLAPPSLAFGRPPILAGSTRPGDERAMLEAWRTIDDRPQLVLAPRHAARFDEVAGSLAGSGLRWERRSALGGSEVPSDLDVLLLDSVGELAGLYPLARVAFIGGTFDPAIGGHSAAEAARAGLPVIHGPHTHANASSYEGIASFGAASPQDLGEALAAAMASSSPPVPSSEAVRRALTQIEPLLSAPFPPEAPHRPWARPLVPAYRALAAGRARRPRAPAPCPVISVGNIASGGTGKTPVVQHLLRALLERGLRPAVVSRGHGRDRHGPAVRDSHSGEPTGAQLGDELAMLGRLGVILVSAPDRLQGVRRACSLGAQVCVLDDGFQQRDVEVWREIVVIDGREPGAGGPLPVGEAREPFEALARADLLWCNHRPFPAALGRHLRAGVQVIQAHTRPVGWWHRRGLLPLEDGPRGPVLALCGIARPGGFLRSIRRLGLVPARRLVFADHHRWGPKELEGIRLASAALPLVTTEKDLARLPEELEPWALSVQLVIDDGGEALEALLDALEDKVRLLEVRR